MVLTSVCILMILGLNTVFVQLYGIQSGLSALLDQMLGGESRRTSIYPAYGVTP